MSRSKLVGITGGIGSGKSTICKIFEVLGVSVYYADDQAKKLMENNTEVVESIKSIFGAEAYKDDTLDRPFISKKAFGNRELLAHLNQVVHPAVNQDFKMWVSENTSEKMLLKEAALLIEAGSYKELDALILVIAEAETRISRVLKRDPHRSEDDIRKIISEQHSDEEKIALADFIIDNNGQQSLIHQVVEIHRQLLIT